MNMVYDVHQYDEMQKVIDDFYYRLKHMSLNQEELGNAKNGQFNHSEFYYDNGLIIKKDVFCMNRILEDFKVFYDVYYAYLSKNINSSKKKNKLYEHFVHLNLLYNDIINFIEGMKVNAHKAYELQKKFLENQSFRHILSLSVTEKQMIQIEVHLKLKILISILCHKSRFDTHKQIIDNDLQQYLKDVKNAEKDSRNQKLYLYVIALYYYYVRKNQKMAYIYLGYLFHYELNFIPQKYLIPLQYTGGSRKSYLTCFFPNDFKLFVQEKMNNMNHSVQQLKELEKQLKNNKK